LTSGAKAKAKALDLKLLVAPSPNWSPAEQTQLVADVIDQGADAIVIQPTARDDDALIAALRKAHDSGVKIVTIDTFIGDNTYEKSGDADFPEAYVGSDNYEGGQIGCEELALAIGMKGKVFLAKSGRASISSTSERERGCREHLANTYPAITIVNGEDETTEGGVGREWSKQLAANYLQSNGDIAGIFAVAYDAAMGTLDALSEANKTGSVKLFVFDCDDETAARIHQGTVAGCVAQKPALMGGTGVQYAYDAMNGKTNLPPRTNTGFIVITSTNIDTKDTAQYVYGTELL
jgi:ribose transport system substrate-binding protein